MTPSLDKSIGLLFVAVTILASCTTLRNLTGVRAGCGNTSKRPLCGAGLPEQTAREIARLRCGDLRNDPRVRNWLEELTLYATTAPAPGTVSAANRMLSDAHEGLPNGFKAVRGHGPYHHIPDPFFEPKPRKDGPKVTPEQTRQAGGPDGGPTQMDDETAAEMAEALNRGGEPYDPTEAGIPMLTHPKKGPLIDYLSKYTRADHVVAVRYQPVLAASQRNARGFVPKSLDLERSTWEGTVVQYSEKMESWGFASVSVKNQEGRPPALFLQLDEASTEKFRRLTKRNVDQTLLGIDDENRVRIEARISEPIADGQFGITVPFAAADPPTTGKEVEKVIMVGGP